MVCDNDVNMVCLCDVDFFERSNAAIYRDDQIRLKLDHAFKDSLESPYPSSNRLGMYVFT